MKNRILWVDIARGLAFLMIIYSHVEYINEALMAFFYPIFLTSFFFISGYLYSKKRNFTQIVEQRFRTILIPFFIYGIINITLSHILTFNEHLSFRKDLLDFLLQIRGNNDRLWFLACLFVTSIPFYFIIKYIPNKLLLAISLVLFIISRVVGFSPIPWHIQLIPSAVFYMTLGYLFKQYESRFSFLDKLYSIPVLSVVYIAVVAVYYSYFQHTMSFFPTEYVVDGLIITTLGLLLCISISKHINKYSRFLIFIGSNSLLYFCLHGKTFSLLQVITQKILLILKINTTDLLSFSLGIAITLITAVVLIIPIIIINKYLPWTIGKGFLLIKRKE